MLNIEDLNIMEFITRYFRAICFYVLLGLLNALVIIMVFQFSTLLDGTTKNVIYTLLGMMDLSCVTPLSQGAKNLVYKIVSPSMISPCQISIIGESGTGKTTLIRSWVGGNKSTFETMEIEYYKSIRIVNNSSHNRHRVVPYEVFDYRGQLTPDALNEVIKGKFKPFTIIFLVDLVPIIYRNNGNEQLISNENDQIAWAQNNINQKIQERIEHHCNKYNDFALAICLNYLKTDKLRHVKIVINKIDIFEKILVDQGYNNEQIKREIEDVINKFNSVKEEINKICRNTQINCDIEIISAKYNKNSLELLENILDEYLSNFSR